MVRLSEQDAVWTRDGQPIEELPDPLSAATPPPEPSEDRPPRRRRWPLVVYTLAAIMILTLLWLGVSAPLSRALEPLPDPALLLLSDDGRPIALRGAIKEAPVDATKLNPLTPAAF